MHGRASYFRHAVAQHTFDMLDNFTWWRLIRMLCQRQAAVSVPRRQVIERVSSARPFRAREQRAMRRVSLEVVIGHLYRPA